MNILLIRCVSLQLLDLIIAKIKQNDAHAQIHVLTHQHSADLTAKHPSIDRVWTYERSGNFSGKIHDVALKGISWDLILVPLGNESGSGFENVKKLALSIPSKDRQTISISGDWKRFNRFSMIAEQMIHTVSAVFGGLVTVVGLVVLLVAMPFISRKHK